MVSLDAVFARLLIVTLDLALSTRPARSTYNDLVSGGLPRSTRLLWRKKLNEGLPYRTLRCEWIIRLASSGVKEESIGSCWDSLILETMLDELDGEGRGGVSGKNRQLSEASWRMRRIGIFDSLGHLARDVRTNPTTKKSDHNRREKQTID